LKITALIGVTALIAFNLTASASASAAEQKAAAKTSHHVRHYRTHAHRRPEDPYAALQPYRSFGFIGAYLGAYALKKSLGECVIDLGYGRFESCD